jgi:hypothetical protein
MDPSDVIRLLRDVRKAITRIAQASGATQDAALDLASLLEELEPELARAIAGATRSAAAHSVLSLAVAKLTVALARILPQPDNPSPKQWQKWHPDVSANVIDIKRQGDGSAMVSIDGRKLAVPPALGDLVSALVVDDGGSSPDDIIPFKPLPDLAVKLQKLKGQPVSAHALNQLIYRLRRHLEQHGFPPFLVQTNRRAGARLALRRQGPALAAQNSGE